MTGVFDKGCERAQEWASLELDGELSQLERVLLATHLRRCGTCAESVAGMRTLTAALRDAPYERPSASVFVATPQPSRKSRPLPVRLSIAAALAVTAAGLGMFAGTLGNSSPAQQPAQTQDDPIVLLTPDAKKDVQGVRPSERTPRDEVGLGSTELFGGV